VRDRQEAERDRKRQKETERGRERERHRDSERKRESERERERKWKRKREREGEREKMKEKGRDTALWARKGGWKICRVERASGRKRVAGTGGEERKIDWVRERGRDNWLKRELKRQWKRKGRGRYSSIHRERGSGNERNGRVER
jgi:U4/U6.U5 tri-snRNP-associated protein 1